MTPIQLKLIIYGVAVLATVAALWGAYTYVDNKGYERAAILYQAKIDKVVADYATKTADELERQAAVNDASKAAEARDIAALQAARDQLEITRKGNADEASKDPDANRPALGADSVRRLNSIH